MKKKSLLVFLLTIIFSFTTSAQNVSKSKPTKITKEDKNLLQTANGFYSAGNYTRALEIYKSLAESYQDNADLLYKTGICYLYKADEKANAIEFITRAGELNPKLSDYYFNLGRAYHINYKFENAIKSFETYLKEKPPIVKKNLAEHYIEFCKNGETISRKDMIIENLGPPVNTEYSEYVPAVSGDETILIFTYKGEHSLGGLMDENFQPSLDGEYYEDVFISYKVGPKWTPPQSIGENINTKGHDASISLSVDGQKLFIFKSTPKDKGDIYMSKLEGDNWSKPERLGPTINTSSWEGSATLSPNEQTLYFASERPGGLGGRDLYKSDKLENGEWGPAVNLGPAINTKYGEDAPFIHPDGVTLFFSSQGRNSLGGYDIFYSHNKSGDWTEAENMGSPINTTDDDLYYVLNPSGDVGYYSSNRKEGYGQQDIYVITPGLTGTKPILALAVGQVLLDSKPTVAKIKVMEDGTGAVKGNFSSNASTGKYMVALAPGLNYKLAIEVEGQEPHFEYVNVKSLETYVQLQEDIQIYSKEYMLANKIDSMSNYGLQKILDRQIQKYNEESVPEVYEARMYQDILKRRGRVEKDSVTYNVDLGTYETAEDLEQSKFADFAKIESLKNTDNSTNFYVGGFKTMAAADSIRSKVIARAPELAKIAQVTISDSGKTRTIPVYYAALYDRKGYVVRRETAIIKTMYNPERDEKRELEKALSQYGDKQLDGLSYKLELAAVDKPSDFKAQNFSKYGKIESKKYPDGKIHYTVGRFKTLKESDEFKRMLTEKEPASAKSVITVFYLEKPKTVKEFFNDPAMLEKLNKAPEPALLASAKKVKEVVPATSTNERTTASTTAVTKKSPNTINSLPATNVAKDEPTPCETGKPYDFSAFIGKTLNDPTTYNQLINVAGGMCMDSLIFKVQVAAYRHPENFRYSNLKPLGYLVETIGPYGDGITRFIMGEFKNMTDAEKLRKKVIKAGTVDAWITATYKGKRYTLEELIPLNFFNKAVN